MDEWPETEDQRDLITEDMDPFEDEEDEAEEELDMFDDTEDDEADDPEEHYEAEAALDELLE